MGEFQHPQWHCRQTTSRHNPYGATRILRLDEDCSDCGSSQVFVGVGDDGLPDTSSWCDDCCDKEADKQRLFDGQPRFIEPGDGTRYTFAIQPCQWQDAGDGIAWLFTFGISSWPLTSAVLVTRGYEPMQPGYFYEKMHGGRLSVYDLSVDYHLFSALTERGLWKYLGSDWALDDRPLVRENLENLEVIIDA